MGVGKDAGQQFSDRALRPDIETASNLNLVLSGIASIVIGNAMVIMIKMTKKRMTAAPIALLLRAALGVNNRSGRPKEPPLREWER